MLSAAKHLQRRFPWLRCFASLSMTFAMSAFGATGSGALTGRIMSGEKPVHGATVTATSNALQAPRVSRTGSYGTYWLEVLPPGVYDVTFSAKGMQTITRRATIELGRVARADAVLEPSEDEETVTSTATTISVGDTTSITTHVSDWLLDRLPIGRDRQLVGMLAPGTGAYVDYLDGATNINPYTFFGEETVEQITVVRGAEPLDEEITSAGGTLLLQTRSGNNEFAFALRDTLTSASWVSGPARGDVEHFFEGTASGPIVRDHLAFFAGGWTGENAGPLDEEGTIVKLTSQLGASHNLIGTWVGARRTYSGETEDTILALHYTGAISPRVTVVSNASRVKHDYTDQIRTVDREDRDALFAKVTYALPTKTGDHVLSAGGSTADVSLYGGFSTFGEDMLFVNDRWSYGRWLLEGGVRRERIDGFNETNPRAAIVYDLRGNGRHALHTTYTRYTPPHDGPYNETTFGYTASLGSSGEFRIDALRTTRGRDERLHVDTEASIRLFDRFEAGATASYFLREELSSTVPRRQANAWVSVDVPFGSQAASFTLLQRYRSDASYGADESDSYTDFGARYRMPIRKVNLTLAADVTDILNQNFRALRLWARIQL